MKKIKLTSKEIKKRLETEADFINSPKHRYSLFKLEDSNSKGRKDKKTGADYRTFNGVNDQFAATLLSMTLEEFRALIKSVINKYRQLLKISID